MLEFSISIPLSLYIHLPWCLQKCPYCDFNSHALRGAIPEDQYIDTLLADLRADLPLIEGQPFTSIFLGGGTPSLFSGSAIARLLDGVRALHPCKPDLEITLEANPGAVEQARFAQYRAAGVNRLSLGIQSLNDAKLKALGRIHGRKEAIAAVAAVRSAGFENFNLDLMYGLPHQTIDEALNDLEEVLALEPLHLSWYHLTLEPNTLFYHQPPPLPDDDQIADLQQQGEALLAAHHFEHYEISAFARRHTQSRHNLNYWEFGDYLGIGAGAHSKITQISKGFVERFSKLKHPKAYLASEGSFIAERHTLNPDEIPLEFMMNTLRLHRPIEIQLAIERTGQPLNTFYKQLEKARDLDLIILTEKTFETTIRGKRFLNELLQIFMR